MCRDIRVGLGYDIHKLVEGRKLILGGVDIPYHLGLMGEPDADVLIHAIIDALLGAASLALRLFGFLPDLFIFNWGYQIGSGLFIFTLSFAIGDKYSQGKAFVPHLLLASRAMNASLDLLKPYFDSGAHQHTSTSTPTHQNICQKFLKL